MGWATSSNVDTGNLDQGTDSPAAARADIKAAFDELKAVIDGRNTANGVAGLDSGTKILATQLPDEINSASSQNLTLDPATGKVKLEEILNLAPQTVSELNGRSDLAEGDVAYCSDGGSDSGGEPCLAVYTGSSWKRIELTDNID